jgi:hypothetical protein
MHQLAGLPCVRCGKLVQSITEGRFCVKCACPVHTRCLRSADHDEIAAGCSECGATPEQQERARTVPRDENPTVRATARFVKWLTVCACAVLVGFMLYCGSLVFGFVLCVPDPNQVKVSIVNLPPGTNFASVASESKGELRSLNWLVGSIRRSEMHPARYARSFPNTEDPKVDWDAFVLWQEADRYGVVTRDVKGAWFITWFGPEVRQDNKAHFDYRKGETVPLSAEQVKALGLERVGR